MDLDTTPRTTSARKYTLDDVPYLVLHGKKDTLRRLLKTHEKELCPLCNGVGYLDEEIETDYCVICTGDGYID